MKRKTRLVISIVAGAIVLAAVGAGILFGLRHRNSVPDTDVPTNPPAPSVHQHDYAQEEVAATCATGGYTLFTCSCGDSYKENETDPIPHEYGDWEITQQATVDAEGTREQKCLHCGSSNTESIPQLENTPSVSVEIPTQPTPKPTTPTTPTNPTGATTPAKPSTQPSAHTHSYTTTVVEATCNAGGYTRHTCSCGDFYDTDQTGRRSHLYSDWVITVYPTTTEEGEQTCSCTRCGHTLTEAVPKRPPETPGEQNGYVDPKVIVRQSPGGATNYGYGSVNVTDTRSWGGRPSVSVTSSGGLSVSYYKQDGSKVYCTVEPREGYVRWMIILEDGTYTVSYVGDFSD